MSKSKTVKLGLMPPLTGLVGIYGTEISRAGQIACREVNENGGVLGMPLELVIEDDGSLPESAVSAAEKLVDVHRCSAIIGNLLSNSRIAVAYRVAEPRKIPLLNFSFYEGSILSRYFFHFAALPNQQIDRMIPCMLKKYGPRMFFAGNNYEWPRGSIDAAKKALLRAGGTVAGEEYTAIGVPAEDIEHLLDQVEAAAPDVFVPYFAGADQVNLLTRFTERGLKQRMAVVMGHYDEIMASILPPAVREGFYSSNTYFMSVDSDANRKYLARLQNFPGVNGLWPPGNGILTNFGEGVYLCVKAYAQAANIAGSLDPEALIDALQTISIAGPQGLVTMNPVHHHAKVNTYLSRCNKEGVFEIIENFGAIEAVLPERYNHQRISHQATLEEDIRLQARMLEQMSEAVFLVSSQNANILYANSGARNIFGYANTEIIDLPIARLEYPGEIDTFNTSAGIIPILHQKGNWKGEARYINRNGRPLCCSVSISTFTHPFYGEVWLWVCSDISAHKQAEERLRLAMEATSDGIWDWNPQTHESYMSPRWKAIFGYRDDELPNVDSTFFDLVHPDDREVLAAAIKRHFDEQVPFQSQIRMLHKDGKYRWILSRGEALRDAKGNPIRMLGAITDISERMLTEETLRQNEAQFRSMIESFPSGVLLVDGEGKIMLVNQRLLELFDYSAEELLGNPVEMLVPHEAMANHANYRDTYLHQPQTRQMGIGRDLFALRKGGTQFQAEIGLQPLETQQGKVILTTVLDITQRKQIEAQLLRHKEELEEQVQLRTAALKSAMMEAERANTAKSDFLSRMSHELRTPLNAILGFGQLLETGAEPALTPTQADFIHEMMHGGKHLLNLINEILDLSRIESGRLEITLEEIPALSIIESCIKQIQPMAAAQQIRISFVPCESCSVNADATRLREVLFNLLSNAAKYNRKGGSIRVSCHVRGKRLRFNVQDSGHGIAAEFLPRLFRPFERLESAYTGIDGTGIGLALAKKLVEAMNGEIGVISEPGMGSTFWFELPLSRATSSADKNAAIQTFAKNTRHNVLYVEDNPANLRLVQKLLAKRNNIEFIAAINGAEGLEIATRERPALILLDLNLPVMDGYEVLLKLKENPLTRTIPVIAVTANAMTHDIERGMAAGFTDYLSKPLDLVRLNEALDEYLLSRYDEYNI